MTIQILYCLAILSELSYENPLMLWAALVTVYHGKIPYSNDYHVFISHLLHLCPALHPKGALRGS